MSIEQSQTLKVLQLALQMEINGKKFYLKASRDSKHGLGKKLLATLAAEEDIHRKKFEEIYEAIRNTKAWPVIDFRPDKGKNIKTVFAQASRESTRSTTSELDAVKVAIDMENKSYDLYKGQAKQATYDAEKKFYDTLAGEERGHQLALTDYLEFLSDPVGWFVAKEHPSLDGG